MAQIKRILDGTIFTVSENPTWVAGMWECGNQRFTDPGADGYEVVSLDNTYPILTPPETRMLFTSPERIAVRGNLACASPDPVLHDFFTELNDPQLRQVDFNLKSVRDAMAYTINFVAPHMSPPYTQDDIARRVAEILAGTPQ